MAFLLLRKTRTKATIVSKPTTPAILTVFELTAPLNESIYSQAIISATPVSRTQYMRFSMRPIVLNLSVGL